MERWDYILCWKGAKSSQYGGRASKEDNCPKVCVCVYGEGVGW